MLRIIIEVSDSIYYVFSDLLVYHSLHNTVFFVILYFVVKCIGSRITLRRAQKKHAGIYQCFATNSVGTVYGSTMLQVSPKQITTNINADRNVYEQREGKFYVVEIYIEHYFSLIYRLYQWRHVEKIKWISVFNTITNI